MVRSFRTFDKVRQCEYLFRNDVVCRVDKEGCDGFIRSSLPAAMSVGLPNPWRESLKTTSRLKFRFFTGNSADIAHLLKII